MSHKTRKKLDNIIECQIDHHEIASKMLFLADKFAPGLSSQNMQM